MLAALDHLKQDDDNRHHEQNAEAALHAAGGIHQCDNEADVGAGLQCQLMFEARPA